MKGPTINFHFFHRENDLQFENRICISSAKEMRHLTVYKNKKKKKNATLLKSKYVCEFSRSVYISFNPQTSSK